MRIRSGVPIAAALGCVLVAAAGLTAGCREVSAPSERPRSITPAVPGAPMPSETTPAEPSATAPFVGRAWRSTDAADAPGTMRIFLPDGTLVMDACGEAYRLTRWSATGEDGIEWEEDTARIEAEILEASDDRLRLRLTLRGGESRDETYQPATVPFVCPDRR